jgi:hypothetical protein
VAGLPGDTVRVRDDQLIINGQPVPISDDGRHRRVLPEHTCPRRLLALTGIRPCPATPAITRRFPVATCNRQIHQSYQHDAVRGHESDRNDT